MTSTSDSSDVGRRAVLETVSKQNGTKAKRYRSKTVPKQNGTKAKRYRSKNESKSHTAQTCSQNQKRQTQKRQDIRKMKFNIATILTLGALASVNAQVNQGGIRGGGGGIHRELCNGVKYEVSISDSDMGQGWPGLEVYSYQVPQGEFCMVGCGPTGTKTWCNTKDWIYGDGYMDCDINTIWINNSGQGDVCHGAYGKIYMQPYKPYENLAYIRYDYDFTKGTGNTCAGDNALLTVYYNDGTPSSTIKASSCDTSKVTFELKPSDIDYTVAFKDYQGNWTLIATSNIANTATYQAQYEYSYGRTSTNEQAFASQLGASASASFMGMGVSASYQESWSSSTTQTINHMSTITFTESCSIECKGDIWMFMTEASDGHGGTASTGSCDLWCSPYGSPIPVCPPNYCGDQDDCSCCISNDWAEPGTEGLPPLC